MAYTCFDVDVTDGVAHLVLKRADELNTMTPEFWRELPEIVSGLSASGEARAVVLSSTGRHFTRRHGPVRLHGEVVAAGWCRCRRRARVGSAPSCG